MERCCAIVCLFSSDTGRQSADYAHSSSTAAAKKAFRQPMLEGWKAEEQRKERGGREACDSQLQRKDPSKKANSSVAFVQRRLASRASWDAACARAVWACVYYRAPGRSRRNRSAAGAGHCGIGKATQTALCSALRETAKWRPQRRLANANARLLFSVGRMCPLRTADGAHCFAHSGHKMSQRADQRHTPTF